jgi:SPP1 family predicted phage head-tail adaptor
MVGMNPGQLRDTAKFYRLERVGDGAAGSTKQLVLAFTTRAKLTPMRAYVAEQNGRQVTIQPYRITIRYYKDKQPESDMQIEFRGGYYQIEEVYETDDHFRYISMKVTRAKPPEQ